MNRTTLSRISSLLPRPFSTSARGASGPSSASSNGLPCATQPARFRVSLALDRVRLDRFIKHSAPGLPPGLIHRHIRQSRVLINGRVERSRATPVRTEDVITFPGHVKLGLTRRKKRPPPDDVSLSEAMLVRGWLLHRDARTAVLNKPPGLPVIAHSQENTSRTLEQLLCALGSGRYWLVHRLQTQVGGAVLVARDVGAATLLADYFRTRMVTRLYWGLVAGVPRHKKGIIDIDISGQKAITKYRVVQMVDSHYAWLEFEPRTGRSNQLSAHCAEGLGTPLVGDTIYPHQQDRQHPITGALQLCSRSITFPRLTQNSASRSRKGTRTASDLITVHAPLPLHMKDTWKRLGLQERFASYSD
ncbi:Ribosomal large subunit pseudouridine synthase C [Gracilariopsis chorda]|uniref:Ribosomal large subunit pseudouridine synthase C n=1 Tax=Gracilariopsis chorda TaxID=448386 RepID=A0A2V3IMI2_9FLOR|nr:Ribosomal large subunit pseudouridine synthase C [Gracilariopsis chorda]|eukprot:PXF43281.1 Ribosomal large subunit pseudouridine synthase C [Gracilariopsis chorda]